MAVSVRGFVREVEGNPPFPLLVSSEGAGVNRRWNARATILRGTGHMVLGAQRRLRLAGHGPLMVSSTEALWARPIQRGVVRGR
jgi:hypothetical protein